MAITFHANGDVTGSGAAGFGASGSVIQVKQAETSTQIASSSGEFDIVSVTLTPTATGNKIFIFGCVMGIQAGGYNNIRFQCIVKRDSTSLMVSDANHWIHGSTLTMRDGGFSINYVDTAPGTSTYTYKLVGKWQDTSGSNAFVNKDNNSGSTTITVMEMKA